MGGAMLFYQVFVPLLLVATPSFSEEKFGLTGGFIVLQAKPMPEKVSNIIWKHNKDKAAEWFDGDDAPTYYNIFTSVTTLDMQTWALNISNLQPHFSGKYSAEVNNKDPTQFVTLNVFGPVSKPTITMDCIDTNCTLTCEGKKDGFTKYTWADGIEEWPGSELTVERRDHDVVYTCNISNPVSWASSQGTVKHVPPPTPTSPPPGPGPVIRVVVVVVLLLIAASIIGGLWVLKRKGKSWSDLRTMTCRDRCRLFIPCIKERKKHGDEEKQEMTNTVTSQGPPGEHKSPEAVPLMPSVTEDKKQPEANTDPLHEEKLAEPVVVPTADGERMEPDENEDSPGMPNPEDNKPPEANTDPVHEEKLTANGPRSTADEEPTFLDVRL